MSVVLKGKRCLFWGTPEQAAKSVVPACPWCASPVDVVEVSDFWSKIVYGGIDRAMVEWSQGQCFPSPQAMIDAYVNRNDKRRRN